MTNYAAGWNMGGYSPDPDHSYITDDWLSAARYIAETIELWWDQDYDKGDYDREVIDGRYLPAHTEIYNATRDSAFHTSIDMGSYTMHMWIEPTDQPADV
jgi:hypothetical protein